VPNLTVPTADAGDLDAYLALPAVGHGPWPGVIVIHDAVGLTDVTRLHADRLATAGYVGLAPDLYTRGGMLRCVKATFASLTSGEGRAYEDLDAARRWLEERDDCTGGSGVIGFCMGGGFALMTAGRGFTAAAPNYAPLPKDMAAALDGACPIVASYGAKDRGLKGTAAKLEAALVDRDIPHDVKEYPDVGHSFLDRFNVGPFAPLVRVAGFGYHQPSAEDAWRRILAFFSEHLRPAPEHLKPAPDAGA
jgi:carboxymethylenebutenolidase